MLRVKQLVIIGAGGFAKSAVDSMDHRAYRICGFIDERPDKLEHIGYPVLAHSLDELENVDSYCYFVAIGNSVKRKYWFGELERRGLRIESIVDPSAIVSPLASLGRGCFVGKLAVINNNAIVEDDCVVNTMALVEHGCHLRKHVNMSTRAVINGDVQVGEGAFLGSCSVTIGQLSIGAWSTVGAGAVVIRDVEPNVTVAGVPAKPIESRRPVHG